MAVITPPTLNALPSPPDPTNRATFNALAYPWSVALGPFGTQANALAANVYGNAADAAASAATATTQAAIAVSSAGAAASSAGATIWVTGTTYAIGAVCWSPATYGSYRRKTAGAGTIDPSADTTNWAPLTGPGAAKYAPVVVTTTAQTAVAFTPYTLTNVATTTVTLPASPNSGDEVYVTVANGLTTNIIARNSQTIMGLAEDMTIDSVTTVTLKFLNSSWRII